MEFSLAKLIIDGHDLTGRATVRSDGQAEIDASSRRGNREDQTERNRSGGTVGQRSDGERERRTYGYGTGATAVGIRERTGQDAEIGGWPRTCIGEG